ncbi:TetR/AcrR family transcriptional regulator [Amycolatopsis sp.]|uniref:TetR/AcrR family transcriptional regulator n=1 Tax=Amycolatopsis sp. TaxID=37632 RepID=UPI002D064FD8|nr:TetR family transcriptional regulator [Amycolatopsis sp.]HVV12566.1 TetR family transcriptional regulator [Amycolatopsis sp.]
MPAAKSRATLNADDIVEAALTLIRERGVDGFSMRQLSERLGASLGATYRHLPTKDALLQQCGKAVFDRSWRPLQDGEEPLEWLQAQVMSLYHVLGEHPGLASYVIRRPQASARDIVDPVHDVLISSGFTEDEAITTGLVLTLYLAGALLSDFEHSVAVETADAGALVAAGVRFILGRR